MEFQKRGDSGGQAVDESNQRDGGGVKRLSG